ncbi:MAG: hypothetical protein KJ648_02055, partial [Candidatus Omnitrophica bacterium]|nr:hypothetical protein [Candidatus Omnitrophota bacterium]
IAIKSSIPRLRSQTPLEDDWCYLSHVVYLDYEKESFKFMFPKNPHTPLVHKREQFYYEKEYRVVKTVYEDVNYFAERGDEEGDNLFRVGRNRGQDRKRASWDRYYVNKPDPGLDPVFDDPAGRPETIWERAVKGDREKSWGISYKLSNLDFIEEVHVDPDAPKSHYEKVRNLIKNSAPELESRLIYKPINLYY